MESYTDDSRPNISTNQVTSFSLSIIFFPFSLREKKKIQPQLHHSFCGAKLALKFNYLLCPYIYYCFFYLFFSCRPHPEQEIILKPNSYGYPYFRDILWLLIYSLHRVREGRNWLGTKKGRDCPWIEPLQFGFPDQLKSIARSDGPIHVQFTPKPHVWFRDRYLQPRPTRKSLSQRKRVWESTFAEVLLKPGAMKKAPEKASEAKLPLIVY